ncbi:MAG TPA: hypothetical protein PLC16_05885 [Defluviitaleaceae bacterium]|nr:hypothetical protein [Defluviitaleaceae bacterium]HPT76252.1 hypothetical protein [Defluviitaleaceae bacterium]
MSKKETEFDRYERMKKIQREMEIQKRKEMDDFRAGKNKKKKKMGFSENNTRRKDWTKYYEADMDDYDEVY